MSVPETTSALAAPARRSRHIHEIDVVRVLTFACVIGVHTVSHTNPAQSVGANALLMLLHFTREAFFFLTGFVLVHQYIRRSLDVRDFYLKRLKTVAVPYLLWTVIYTYLPQHWHLTSASIATLAKNAALGTATYHLYFLLVSLQIYLLYPMIAGLIRATVGHHRALLVISGGVQLALYAYLQYGPAPTGWWGTLLSHEDALITSYQFYVLLGAVAAYHCDRVRDWIADNRGLIFACSLALGALALGWYLVAEASGRAPESAAAVLQPVMIVWAIGAIGALFAVGSIWSQRRQAGSRLDRALSYGSDRSFGIFLVHPAILGYVLDLGWIRRLPAVPQGVVAYTATVAGSLVAVELFRRSPLSQMLTGRTMLRPTAGARVPNPDFHKKNIDAAQGRQQRGGEDLGGPSAGDGRTSAGDGRTSAGDGRTSAGDGGTRKGTDDALHSTSPARAPEQAPHDRRDDGDGWRAPDPVLPGRRL